MNSSPATPSGEELVEVALGVAATRATKRGRLLGDPD
jgi:hypothetical protein